MKKDNLGERVIPLIRSAVSTLFTHRVIFFPFMIIAFLQLLILEILYFFPRFPLVNFFGPIIRKIWGEKFLHYPDNFIVLPKLFQSIQLPLYILVSMFFICVAINLIGRVNEGKTPSFKAACKEVLPQYVHIVVAALFVFCFIWIFFKVYGLIYNRALQIRSQAGWFYYLKVSVTEGASYFNLLWTVFITSILGYIFPSIAIGKKKIFAAIGSNFKVLWGGFWVTLCIVLLPSLLYIPILWLRKIITVESFLPELSVMTLIISILLSVIIDAVIYTAITIRYLLVAERK